jgi:hypothetical protein
MEGNIGRQHGQRDHLRAFLPRAFRISPTTQSMSPNKTRWRRQRQNSPSALPHDSPHLKTPSANQAIATCSEAT